jgi:hypothetical protein
MELLTGNLALSNRGIPFLLSDSDIRRIGGRKFLVVTNPSNHGSPIKTFGDDGLIVED